MAASVIAHRLAQRRAPVSRHAAIHHHSSEVSVSACRVVEAGAAASSFSEISVTNRRVIECSAAAIRCQVSGGVRTLIGVYGSNFQRFGSRPATAPSNNAFKRRRAKTHAP
mgnify:CR=1 FL=1